MSLRSLIEKGRQPVKSKISFGQLITAMWGLLSLGVWFAFFVQAQAEHGTLSIHVLVPTPWLLLSLALIMGGGRLFHVKESLTCSRCIIASITEARYGCQEVDCNAPLCSHCFESSSEPRCLIHWNPGV